VKVDVAPTAVVGGEVEDDVDPADGPTSQPLVQEVALEELDVEIVKVLGAPGREVVDHPDGGSAAKERLHEVGADERCAPGDESDGSTPVHLTTFHVARSFSEVKWGG
jgi:hypothetical protein